MTEEKYIAYEKAVRQVWADGQVSLDEADMIEALRKSLNITLEEHAEIEKKIRREYEKSLKEGKPLADTPPSGTREAAPKEEPTPPSTPEPPEPGPEPGGMEDDPIGDLSSEELSKDLDDLSKSIGQLGEKIFGADGYKKAKASDSEEDANAEIDKSPVSDEPSEIKEAEGAAVPAENEGTSNLLEQLKSQYKLDTDDDQAAVDEIKKPDDEDLEDWTPPDDTAEPEPSDQEPPIAAEQEEEETFEEYLSAGKEAFREKDYKMAVNFLKKAMKIEPDNKEVKFFLKKVATAIKKMKGAQADTPSAEEEDTSAEPKPSPATEDGPETADKDAVKAEAEDTPDDSEAEVTVSTKDCSSCGGSGICNWCKGGMKCYWCNGSGKCTKCKGEKEINGDPCGFCNAEGICGSCEGTGNCTWCKGTGKCNSCSMDKS